MANVKISELTECTTLAGSDQFLVNDGGTSKRVAAMKLLGYRMYANRNSGDDGDTLGEANDVNFCDATSGAFTIKLPDAATYPAHQYTLIKIDSSANAVTIGRTGTDTINGATSYSLSGQYDSVTVVSKGSGVWYITASTT